MKKSAGLILLLAFLFWSESARASREDEESSKPANEKVPLDIFETENGYVFESDLNHGGSFGKQDELQNEFEYGHRFLLNGNLYLHLGAAYDRLDFGSTRAPVPDHLQKMAGVIGIDYMHGKDLGAFLQFRPGFYFEDHIGSESFDCPILLGRFWVLQPEKLYVLTAAYASFLRGGLPVMPLVGVVWIPNEKVRLMGVLPEPKLIYSLTKQLDLWVGGQLVGGAFRTDHHPEFDDIRHVEKLSGTQVDYYDYRAGVGARYSLTDQIDLDLGGGCSIQRSFNFHRAGEYYRTDPAPYLRFEIKAKF
jgi:hypothetical protein